MKKQNTFIGKISIPFLLPILGNLMYLSDPGFTQLHTLPYVICVLLVSSLGGVALGLVAWAVLASFIVLFATFTGLEPFQPFSTLSARFIWGVLPVLVYIFGRINDVIRSTDRELRNRFRTLVRKNQRYHRMLQELMKVNGVLEERVARQQDSLTLLYNQVQAIRTLNLEKALKVLLETVQMFLQARRVVFWTLDSNANLLRMELFLGEGDGSLEEYLSLTDSVEGWAYRNSTLFSFRMLVQYDNLKKIYRGRTLIAIPVHAGRKPYGVLSIEELPFERYNLYSERLLQIIVGLAEPFLGDILEYYQLANLRDVDEDTGIPHYSQFYNLLQNELERAKAHSSVLSVIVFEVENFMVLANEFGKKAAKQRLKEIVEELSLSTDSRYSAFLYREEGQLVFLCPNLDQDGAALFCLESLEHLNQREWRIGESSIALSMLVGYATARPGSYELEPLLQQVDHLLLLQKM